MKEERKNRFKKMWFDDNVAFMYETRLNGFLKTTGTDVKAQTLEPVFTI